MATFKTLSKCSRNLKFRSAFLAYCFSRLESSPPRVFSDQSTELRRPRINRRDHRNHASIFGRKSCDSSFSLSPPFLWSDYSSPFELCNVSSCNVQSGCWHTDRYTDRIYQRLTILYIVSPCKNDYSFFFVRSPKTIGIMALPVHQAASRAFSGGILFLEGVNERANTSIDRRRIFRPIVLFLYSGRPDGVSPTNLSLRIHSARIIVLDRRNYLDIEK